jgi:chemotaxis protein CheD
MDPDKNSRRLHVIQGDFVVTDDASVVLATLLGSCVAACMTDPVAKVGGMNHFLLPDVGRAATSSGGLTVGVHLMELLVNGLMQRGARRERLHVKLFGGAKMFGGLTDIGGRNADFAEEFVRKEGFRYLGGSLRGTNGRRIQFWPTTGRARQIFVDEAVAMDNPTVLPRTEKITSGDLELF